MNALTIIGITFLVIAIILLAINSRQEEKRYKKLLKDYNHRLIILSLLPLAEARVKESDSLFTVYRTISGRDYPVSYVHFDPNDPDDKEYKRIHAEEIASILNEKP